MPNRSSTHPHPTHTQTPPTHTRNPPTHLLTRPRSCPAHTKQVLHHRFLGRVTIGVSCIHFGFYAKRMGTHFTEQPYWTGTAALMCGLAIVATTTNWMRRNQFNVFFWTHYAFFGFFAFAFFHVKLAQPFLGIAICT
jgi:hypothetical protein